MIRLHTAEKVGMDTLPEGNVTFLFTDIEGSTSLQLRFGHAMAAAQERHDALIRDLALAEGGFIYRYIGDACLAVFVDAPAALNTALAAQRILLDEAPWREFHPDFEPLLVRMALHTGEGIKTGGEYHCAAASITDRVLGLAAGGQVLLSVTTFEALAGYVPDGTSLIDLGEQYIGGFDERMTVFRLNAPDLPIREIRKSRDVGRLIYISDHPPTSRRPADLVPEVESAARSEKPVPMTRAELRSLIAHPPRDWPAYRAVRIAEWCQGRHKLDERFVRMSLSLGPQHRGASEPDTPPERFSGLQEALDRRDEPALMVVGEPGSGKSTLLRRLELTSAVDSISDFGNTVTFYIPLSGYRPGPDGDPWSWLQHRWAERNPLLPPLSSLLSERRLLLLLDALNEMPHTTEQQYRQLVLGWRRFITETLAEQPGNRAVFTCRKQDYSTQLSSTYAPVPQLTLEPLDDDQVRDFLKVYCHLQADDVWQTLAGTKELEWVRTPYFLDMLAEQAGSGGMLAGSRVALFTGFLRRALQRELQSENPHFTADTLLTLEDISRAEENVHWPNPWALPDEGSLEPGLRRLAADMQRSFGGSEPSQVRVPYNAAVALADGAGAALLQVGFDLGVLDQDPATDEVLFRHQLLQEYFAARDIARAPEPSLAASEWRADAIRPSLDETLADLAPPDPLPPPPATGWEETMVLAAAMTDDPVSFVEQLAEDNLPLAGRCAAQPDVRLPEPVKDRLRWQLVARSRDPSADLRARIQAGLALGELGDPRFERHVGPYGEYMLPPFVDIPGGVYTIGSDDGIYPDEEEPVHQVEIAPFKMAVSPVTNAEWALFMKAGGYEDERWWETEAAKAWRRGEGTADASRWNARLGRQQLLAEPHTLNDDLRNGAITIERHDELVRRLSMSDEKFESYLEELFPNLPLRWPRLWHVWSLRSASQPVVGVNCFEAGAYCAWLTEQTGNSIRLPSEEEWEAAARGFEGRRFAYGNDFDASRCNAADTHVRMSTPIGVFPLGDTSQGIADLTGNVNEWTSSSFQPPSEHHLSGASAPDGPVGATRENQSPTRIARGGGWYQSEADVRSACRFWNAPGARYEHLGLRLVRAAS
jgi:formylglycine-generating enzyme required for sulfatase activity/class 3 adenylate cyclase